MIPETKEYTYQPGTCNLGKQEINRRFRIGFIGLGLMIILMLSITFFHLATIYKIFLFIPAFYSVSGFVQAFNKFCYIYGLKGVTSLTGRKKFEHVSDEIFFKADRKKAFAIITITALSSAAMTILYILLSS
ncbi:MAG: hypothetical protein ABJB16_01920 [Saprospiraceae bacterium]